MNVKRCIVQTALFYQDIITLGLCLPASCSTNDLSFILEGIFRDRVLVIGDFYSADFRLLEVKDLKDDHQWLFSGSVLFIGYVVRCMMFAISAMAQLVSTTV